VYYAQRSEFLSTVEQLQFQRTMHPATVLVRLRDLVLHTPAGQLLDHKQAVACNDGSHHLAKRLANIARKDKTIVLECAPGRKRGCWRKVGVPAPATEATDAAPIWDDYWHDYWHTGADGSHVVSPKYARSLVESGTPGEWPVSTSQRRLTKEPLSDAAAVPLNYKGSCGRRAVHPRAGGSTAEKYADENTEPPVTEPRPAGVVRLIAATLDVPIDLNKPDDFHDDYCTHCKRSGIALVGCAAAHCYASFCTRALCSKAGTTWNGLYICGPCKHASDSIGDDFDAAEKASSADKVACNNAFVKHVRDLQRAPPGGKRKRIARGLSTPTKTLVLDGVGAQTTRALISCGATVFVANPNPLVCTAVTQSGGEAHCMRLSRYLTTVRDDPFYRVSCAWLDYCGTYDGSAATKIYPRQDLAKLWDTGLDTSGPAVVAATFCLRNNRTTVEEIVAEQKETASLNGWRARVAETKRYGVMLFLVFHAARV